MKTVLCITTACMMGLPALSQQVQPIDNFAFSQHSATSNTITLMDSSFHYNNWNSTTNHWNSALKYIYNYNAFYKQDAEFIYNLLGVTWLNTRKGINYVFDANHNMLERTHEQLVSGSWQESSKETCTYDASDNLLTSLQQSIISGSLVNQSNFIYTYAGNNNTSYTYQSWNTSAGAWVNVVRNTYTYNTNDRITSAAQATWTAGAWVNDKRSSNYVYVGTELTSYETETWNTATSAYEPYTKTSHTYDVNHYLLNDITVKWNASTASWDNFSRGDYTYDAHGNLASLLLQTWDNVSGSWKNQHKSTYFHRTGYVGVNESSLKKSGLVVHPNPASEHITVSVPGREASTLTITDLSGKTVLKNETDQADHFSIDIRALEAGMYFMELRNEQGSAKGKFIKN